MKSSEVQCVFCGVKDLTRENFTGSCVACLCKTVWTVATSPGNAHSSRNSPDLVPNDFHLFLHLKKFLSGQHQRFQNDREAEMNVTQWFQSQAADLYDTEIQKLIPRHDKCLNSGDECVEK